MRRIIAMVLAGGLSAATLAAAPARADERGYDRRDGAHEEYDRRAPPPQRHDRGEHEARDRRDEDAYRGGDRRYDDRDQHERRDRHASVDVRPGEVGVHVDAGNWLMRG
jgi:Ni/Co efflux regulator RcnB